MADAADKTAQLLKTLWQKNLPIFQERISILQQAADELSHTHSLTPELRDEAASTAHKLAGALGMFGFPKGTDLARQMEQLLIEPRELTANDAAAFSVWVKELTQSVKI
jgi:HPt (histidine-containing phosphotransfer) domain-containing protein